MVRVLIAGLGSIGRRHLRNLLRLGVDDILLYRTRPDPPEEAPELPVFTDLSLALAARPDVVIVSNPTSHHLRVAVPAAEAGCHLFIEKPLSHSWAGVDELLATVRRRGLITLMGFDLRFDPGLRTIRGLLADGRIGRVVGVQAQVGQYLPDWHPWEDYRRGVSARVEAGGGVILDLIHELDYLTWLLGPASSVACFADRVSGLEIETEDTAAMLLRFANRRDRHGPPGLHPAHRQSHLSDHRRRGRDPLGLPCRKRALVRGPPGRVGRVHLPGPHPGRPLPG